MNPAQVSVAPSATTVESVDQRVVFVDGAAKRDILVELMNDAAVSRAIVFTRTKRGADRVAEHLETAGVGAAAIHGNKSQNQRIRALEGFRRGDTRVLVATDIAARGIDIDGVTHVVNFELPETPEAYVHRIGRTARAGASGRAISLCDNGERPLLRQIEKLTRQTIAFTDRRNADARQGDSGRQFPAARGVRQRPHGDDPRLDSQRPGGARPARSAEGPKRPHRSAAQKPSPAVLSRHADGRQIRTFGPR